MIHFKHKVDCCGCWACAQVCPKQCISMPEDSEGFCYPQIDLESCINCGLCERVCPIINHKKVLENPNQAFIVQHHDDDILKQSTSGGAFTALAEYIIGNGGVVCGAIFDSEFEVRHGFVEKIEELWKFRNSKYVQSIIGNAFKETKAWLDSGKIVLFSGTPCQTEGLLNFLGRKYENLWTVDFICRAVPSPLVLRKYLKSFDHADPLIDVKFRYKQYGYKYSSMRIRWCTSGEYHEGVDTDSYLRAFFEGMSIRQSCSMCKFRSIYRRTDFTIGDCFEVGNICPELDNDKGVSRVLCHTERASQLIQQLGDKLSIVKVKLHEIVNPEREETWKVELNLLRDYFFEDMNNSCLTPKEVFDKYFPITWKTRIDKYIRLLLNKIRIYGCAKKIQRHLKR